MKSQTNRVFVWNSKAGQRMINLKPLSFKAEDWIRVSDHLPAVGQRVLIFVDHPSQGAIRSGVFEGHLMQWGIWVVSPNYMVSADFQVTHWMPLPDRKKQK